MFGLKLIKDKEYEDLHETLTRFERTLEDIGWVNTSLDQFDQSQQLFGQGGFRKMIDRCRLFYTCNPLAGHWVHLTTWFVFGEGVSKPKAKDEKVQEVIDSFWNDPDNQLSLTGFSAQQMLSNKLQYEGNIFFVLFDDDKGDVRVRILNTKEVEDVIYDEDDRMRPNFYKVRLSQNKYNFRSGTREAVTSKIIYYPDKENFNPRDFDVPSDMLRDDAKIFHVKINTDINDRFGVPDLFRGLDWMRTHKDMAGDLATFIKSLTRFAWKKKVKGSAAQVNAIKAAMQTKTDLSNIRNASGQMQIENEGVDLQAINMPTGGIKNSTDGLRQMKLMVAASSGLFEHYFGDPSTGNLATAKTMELPMVKKFTASQRLWTGVYDEILQHVINMKIDVGVFPGNRIVDEKNDRVTFETDIDRTIDIDFPPILETDLKELGDALQVAKSNKMVSGELAAQLFMLGANVNNIEEEIEKIKQESGEENLDKPKEGVIPKEEGPEDVKETIDATPNKAERFEKKRRFMEQRMNGYRKAIAGHFRRLREDVKKGMKVSGMEGRFVGNVINIEESLFKFSEGMRNAARVYFPIAVKIGEDFIRAEFKDMNIQFKEANGEADDVLRESLQWNDDFITNSLIPNINEGVMNTVKTEYPNEKDFRSSINNKLDSFESRIEHYVGAFWTVEEKAVREAGKGSSVMVNFAGPDDDHSCPGCENAVAGNPWLIDDAPIPGEQDCRGRCRHALQIIT